MRVNIYNLLAEPLSIISFRMHLHFHSALLAHSLLRCLVGSVRYLCARVFFPQQLDASAPSVGDELASAPLQRRVTEHAGSADSSRESSTVALPELIQHLECS
jgi:hypothetical protein